MTKNLPNLLREIGDLRRLKKCQARIAYAGRDPSVTQSGELTDKQEYISKRGLTHFRWTMRLVATATTSSDPALKALV